MSYFLTVFTVAACVVAIEAAAISGVTPSEHFNHSTVLDADGNYFLFWNYNSSHVTFEIHVKTRGYVGFGLSPNGNMYPADVIVGWVLKDGTVHFKDRHTTAHASPEVDKSQDWFLISGQENDFGTILKFVRKIDTCDDQDIAINDGTQRVIYSYHPDDPSAENQLPYHGGERRGTKSLALLNDNLPPTSMEHAEAKIYDFTADNFIIPDKYTTYWCTGYQMPNIGGKHHMIEFEPIFTPGNEVYLHHLVLQRCPGHHPELHMKGGECTFDWPKDFPSCPEVFLAWAAGGGPFYFPENAGYSVGAPDDYSFYVMQVHYTNPSHKTGIIDNSGIRMRITPKLRQYDVGSFIVGHSVTPLMVVPPHEQAHVTKGYCAEQCIDEALHEKGFEEVKVIAAMQHAHLLATSIITRHFRNGTELEPVINDPNYDYYFQEYRNLKQEVAIKKGDSFLVECTYNTMGRTETAFGGFATREEMCETLFYHYPRLDRLVCNSKPDLTPIYNKTVEYSANDWNEFRSFVNTNFDWTNPEAKRNFSAILKEVDYVHGCYGSNPSKPNWHGSSFTYKEDGPYTPYVPPQPTCN